VTRRSRVHEKGLKKTQGNLKKNSVKNGAEKAKLGTKVMVSKSEELKENQVNKWEGTGKGWAANAKAETK
jgi:hypothetical protein